MGDPEDRSIAGGGGRTRPPMRGEADERSAPGNGV